MVSLSNELVMYLLYFDSIIQVFITLQILAIMIPFICLIVVFYDQYSLIICFIKQNILIIKVISIPV